MQNTMDEGGVLNSCMCLPKLQRHTPAHTNSLLRCVRCREVEFIQKEDVERRRLEEAEKAHLAEIQGLQVRVKQILLCAPKISVNEFVLVWSLHRDIYHGAGETSSQLHVRIFTAR